MQLQVKIYYAATQQAYRTCLLLVMCSDSTKTNIYAPHYACYRKKCIKSFMKSLQHLLSFRSLWNLKN